MRTFRSLAILSTLAVFVANTGCKKNHDDNIANNNPTSTDFGQGTGKCRISSVAWPLLGLNEKFLYDASNRLVQVQDLFTSTVYRAFTYPDKNTILRETFNPSTHDTISLDNSGRIIRIASVRTTPSFYGQSIFNYSGSGQLLSIISNYVNAPNDTDSYTWQNGDVTLHTGFINEAFGYYTKSSQYANDAQFGGFDAYGRPLYAPAHMLLTKSGGGQNINHAYRYDSDGKVLDDSISTNGSLSVRSFQYECQ